MRRALKKHPDIHIQYIPWKRLVRYLDGMQGTNMEDSPQLTNQPPSRPPPASHFPLLSIPFSLRHPQNPARYRLIPAQ